MFKKDIWYIEWKEAEKAGQNDYAEVCKAIYRDCVMEELQKPHLIFYDRLKQFPAINLN